MEIPQGYPQEEQQQIPMYTPEGSIANIVGQIDPSTIIDNLNHSLKGEFFDKESGLWKMNPSGVPLVNDACRGFIISYITGIMNNNSTMAIITQNQLGFIMESVIEELGKEFVCNLERFGFVPPGVGYKKGCYENKGTPDSARMSSVCGMVFRAVFSCYTRSLNGMESRKMWGSLHMTDAMNYSPPQEQSAGWMGRMFGRS
tara:strand:- start:2782 stop:3384 length:603 start_codon:yes stop_codon:yes gene_type:complete